MRRGFSLPLSIILLLLVGCRAHNSRPLKPWQPTPTESALIIQSEPQLVSFEELATNPRLFLNQSLQVTGSYTRLSAAACDPYKGPRITRALVAQNLQMNTVGYESVLGLAPEGQILTLEGVWRYYDGPLGCGKEPARAGVWYLAVLHIVQPNPLPQAGTVSLITPVSAESTPDINGLNATSAADLTATPEPGDFGTPVVPLPPTATATPINVAPPLPGTPTPPLLVTATPLPRATQPGNLPTATPATTTPTPTPGASTTPTPPNLPTLPSGPGTPGSCGYPPGQDCRTSTPYP